MHTNDKRATLFLGTLSMFSGVLRNIRKNAGKNCLTRRLASIDIIPGPDYFDTDFGLLRNIPITERMTLQFRAEFFNVFNNVNFAAPDVSVADGPVFGTVTSTAPSPPGEGGGDPRILQFALKFLF